MGPPLAPARRDRKGARREARYQTGLSPRAVRGKSLHIMEILGATPREIAFVALLLAIVLLGTKSGDIGAAFGRLVSRR